MTQARFLAAALALAVALSGPSAAAPDRYKSEATDPARDATDGVDGRHKRAFAFWTNQGEFSKWKPASYQLGRPYFIPVLGAPGMTPIYFPPQRLNLNPGFPVHNPLPKRPFKGEWYLPPTTEKTTTTTMKIINRFNDDDDEFDDRPVWGTSADSSMLDSDRKGSIIPTRPPKPPGISEFPPLVHDINRQGTNSLTAQSSVKAEAPVPRMTTSAPATTGPSNCVWAIVSCCSASNNKIPDKCFEQRGCPGPFWGASPCDSDYAKAAINSALNYYGGA